MLSPTSTGRVVHPVAAKVPQITVLFWLVKVLTTGMGESASDFLGEKNLVLGGAVGIIGFAAALWLQFRTPRYRAGVYWFAVSMVAVFGTMAADVVHVVLSLPYPVTTAGYAAAVAVLFVLWHRSEGTLSIHSILTHRREQFYWATVLATFALGTAAGDLTAFALHMGFGASAILYGGLILLPLIAWRLRWLNGVAAFWSAYVLTRPLGASIADWLGKPRDHGGLGFGDGTVTLVAAVLIAALVAYVASTGRDVQPAVDDELLVGDDALTLPATAL